MRTANRIRYALVALALVVTATACTDAPQELAGHRPAEPKELFELQRDHERCLSSEGNADGEVRYSDYQACMSTRGWSDPDLTQRG